MLKFSQKLVVAFLETTNLDEGDIIPDCQIQSWISQEKPLWQARLAVSDWTEQFLRDAGKMVSCQAVDGLGVKVLTPAETTRFIDKRDRMARAKILRAHEGCIRGVDRSKLTPEQLNYLERVSARVARNYLAVKDKPREPHDLLKEARAQSQKDKPHKQ